MSRAVPASGPARPGGIQVLVVGIGGASHAIAVAEIVEALPMIGCRPLPGAPPWLRGVMNRRGELLPLIDAGVLLGGAPTAPRRASRVVVIEVDPSRGRRVGLAVESTGSITVVDFEARGAHPGLDRTGGEHLGPIALDARATIQLLRLRDLLGEAGWSTLFGRVESAEAGAGAGAGDAEAGPAEDGSAERGP